MPITKSAITRMRSDKKKHARNIHVISRLKSLGKTYTTTLTTQDVEKAQAEALQLSKLLDKAASKGIIPMPRANRKKSRVAKALHKLVAAQSNK
ncbi:MAG: 30S ribosomal protein S20 [Candidatus Omnitrophica bacterium]|nr:30S ribosomal protein S20 [Candidatus Omnitrophota bacterium]